MMKLTMSNLTELINKNLYQSIQSSPLDTDLEESMMYSLKAGGKRIRPVLLLLTLDMLNEDYNKGLQSALALETIHTYSLIHDDLPSMDNDDYRRDKLTNHKVFGEWKAILAGDALLTKAFELISNDTIIEDVIKVKVIQRLAKASGHIGMVGGQTLDMQSENQSVTLDTLEAIHKTKTGALLNFSVMSAVDIAQADSVTADLLNTFSHHLGLMFQIKDDLLDVYGDEQKLGKAVGSDETNHKSTYVSLLGKNGTEKKLKHHKDLALDCLKNLPNQYDTSKLVDIVDLFYSRDY
ncbi:polyprenyl synthetase family protein [Staphylococcus saccharolyticus]|uniref:polyprenyl synthetase family protein n=1 Tax=Staphylococcus saccharolyticus TaxID=33028 RepID=UPI0018F88092|nr:farnesyl diphosphate synthase [Staphylococcus saccharolyticus]MBL7573267.1 polyprenyl synthetase family protein [Staphylococcus saccharolyticus]MBL7583798.1 polyprenyl synthetase family protein [Staphylococcus saccharolyticus]MBL7638884.1 polyprenyl synthetase family protein [Staphylococcus saccharolyticus]QRJ67639.1 polyprenyl synthetase family protein [Staphylococcus saccharolyticus]